MIRIIKIESHAFSCAVGGCHITYMNDVDQTLNIISNYIYNFIKTQTNIIIIIRSHIIVYNLVD